MYASDVLGLIVIMSGLLLYRWYDVHADDEEEEVIVFEPIESSLEEPLLPPFQQRMDDVSV